MHRLSIFVLLLIMTGCIQETAIPLGNDMMEIDVSADKFTGRAGAIDAAYKKAAQATIDAGYDKFIVADNNGWNETTINGASYGQASINSSQGQATSSSFVGSNRHPEVKMTIRMYHEDDRGANKAVDARAILAQKKSS